MNYRKILIVFCLFIFISQFGIMAATTKINMNFKGADIRDVLRTIAELAKVNLVTDSSVSGEITVHLKD
ncbi:MAG: type II and III secretion system protein, partial [Halanaerobiales bacterium]